MKCNILRGTRAYLVGGMQYENGRNWRETIKEQLVPLGITCFDPYHKPFTSATPEDEKSRKLLNVWMQTNQYDKVASRMKKIRAEDLRLTDISDFIIVRINPAIASWGSAEEIFTANRAKKPIFVIVEGTKSKTPLWILGTLPHKYIYDSLDDVVTMLKRINSGKKKIDSDRWRLLKPEYLK